VGGVADDEIAAWDTSSADAAAVDVAVGAVSNAENLTFIQLKKDFFFCGSCCDTARITSYILLNSWMTSE
jgi:hypothetical protein